MTSIFTRAQEIFTAEVAEQTLNELRVLCVFCG